MSENETIDTLRRMLDDAKRLAAVSGEDPVLEGRAPFLVAYLNDILSLKAPFETIGHIVEFE